MKKQNWFAARDARDSSSDRRRRSRGFAETLESRWVMAAPTLAAISNVTLTAGAPLNIALDGFDADGDALQFSASVTANAGNVSTFVPQGNDSLRLHVVQKNAGGTVLQDFGTMEFQLFDDLVPVATARIEQLVNQGFYNDLTFHRVISNFMIQGGDPAGTGSGGNGTKFDDEFDTSLRFTSSGILAMAKTTDDTSDSQFFITAAPTRWLDFQHTIFGFLTKGDSVRQAINSVPTGANDKPTNQVVITSATIFSDVENGVLRLSAPIGATGTSVVTVTVGDGHGGTTQRSFNVTVVADSAANNGNPFLKPINEMNAVVGQTVTQTLSAVDAEGDIIGFWGYQPPTGIDFNYGLATDGNPTKYTRGATTNNVATATLNIITSTPGKKTQRVLVLPGNSDGSNSALYDEQDIKINVSPKAPTAIDLLPASDDGPSNSDNFTSLNNSSAANKLTFKVSGVWQGSSVTLKIGNRVIGTGVAPAASPGVTPTLIDFNITTNGTEALTAGVNSIVAVQSVEGLVSTVSNPLKVILDNRPPGDGTRDGAVDGADYVIWADNFLRPNRLGPQQGDFNWDGTVDGADYVVWADHFAPIAVAAALPQAAAPVMSQLPTAPERESVQRNLVDETAVYSITFAVSTGTIVATTAASPPAAIVPARAAEQTEAAPALNLDRFDVDGSASDSRDANGLSSARVSDASHKLTMLVDELFKRLGQDETESISRFQQKRNRGRLS